MSFYELALLLPFILPLCSAQSTYYVTPTPDTPCPVDSCLSFVEHTRQGGGHLENATLVFLPGTHTIESSIDIGNLTSLTLLGDPSFLPQVTSRINCSQPASVNFQCIENLFINALGIVSCGSDDALGIVSCGSDDYVYGSAMVDELYGSADTVTYSDYYGSEENYQGAAVVAKSIQNMTISNCLFQNNTKGGAVAVVSSSLIVSQTTFKSNSASIGGGVYIENSVADFTGNQFENNQASNDGGGVYIKYSNVNLTGNQFENNQASNDGGGVYIVNSVADFTGNQFENNQADHNGGGVYIVNSASNYTENQFENNTADYYGGGVYIENSDYYGGGVYIENSVVNLTGNLFENNKADYGGGVVILLYTGSSMIYFAENVFMNNTAGTDDYGDGGGVYIENRNSVADFTGNQFETNQAANNGGGVYIENSDADFTGNQFENNQASNDGGGVYIENYIESSVANFTGNQFENNQASNDGGGVYIKYSNVNLTGNLFENNKANSSGGAIDMVSSTATFEGNTTFQRNMAKESGGVMFIDGSTVTFSGNAHFTTNSALFGGAIFIAQSTMSYLGDTTFDNNTANSGGGIEAMGSYLTFQRNTVFQNNSAVNGAGGAVYAISSNLTTCEKLTFLTNSATYGGAVYAVQCCLNLEGENIVMKNSASRDGGGLLLASDSRYYLFPNATISFAHNTAMQNGGAIKVDVSNQLVYCLGTSLASTLNECFFQLNSNITIKNKMQLNVSNVRMDFNNNTAGEGGSDIYGGAVDNCGLQSVQISDHSSDFQSSGSVLDNITANSPETLDVSSDPLRICVCENNEANCNSSSITRCAYPGGKFMVSVIALGQRNGSVSAVIAADLTQATNIRFDSLHDIQDINNTCTDIEYTVFSSVEETQEDVALYAQGPCPREGRSVELKVEVLKCPRGFNYSSNESICVCNKRLEKLTDASCAVEKGTILRPQGASFWVGYSNKSQSGKKSDGLILHPHCPFDYCTSRSLEFYLSANDSNMQCSYNRSIEFYLSANGSNIQCNYNRTGKLCGECIQDLSLVLGSSNCMQCSNLNSRLALLVAFAFAGIALVFFLFLLKLTVAVGTINGLVFYANVVQVNSAVFFQPGTANILTVFIAWLNLDLGIETCFYDGMDAYAKTWLQFLFPVYVWTLVGIIILFSHFSQMISRLLGTNPIAVLCTLFLLSYAKVLRTIIAILSFATLEYPNRHENVWLQDGNVTYLQGRHVLLFLVAMSALLFLFLPYSLLLFCGQWLQGMSDSRVFSWIKKPTIKSILDAYHAPYAAKHRYWTGFLLFTRSSLFLIYAFNNLRDTDVNLFCITAVTLVIIVIGFVAERIYANQYLGALEASFIINLGVLAAATIAFGRLNALAYTSVSIAFVTFIGIVVYHSHLQLKDYELVKKIANLTVDTFRRRKKYILNVEDKDKELTTSTQSVVSLREPLLEDEV